MRAAYERIILEAVVEATPEDAEQIEEVMRTQFSTLDHLERHELIEYSQEAWEVVKILRKDGIYPTPAETGATITEVKT